jgi:hypothetical protein
MPPEKYLKEIFVEKGLTFCKLDHLKAIKKASD